MGFINKSCRSMSTNLCHLLLYALFILYRAYFASKVDFFICKTEILKKSVGPISVGWGLFSATLGSQSWTIEKEDQFGKRGSKILMNFSALPTASVIDV